MEMGCDGVLEEVNDEITNKDKQRRASTSKLKALGNYFYYGSGEHKAGAECDKISQIGTVPMFLNDDGATENIRGGRGRPEQ